MHLLHCFKHRINPWLHFIGSHVERDQYLHRRQPNLNFRLAHKRRAQISNGFGNLLEPRLLLRIQTVKDAHQNVGDTSDVTLRTHTNVHLQLLLNNLLQRTDSSDFSDMLPHRVHQLTKDTLLHLVDGIGGAVLG